MNVRILHIAYDFGLLQTRELMLKGRGYDVMSVLGNEQAMALSTETLSSFDLAVIGFSSAYSNRAAMLEWFKARVPTLPIIVLQFNPFERFPAADCVTLCEDPASWLSVVAEYLQSC